MDTRNRIDKWFMRVKDIILIFAGSGSLFVFLFKYYALPQEVAEHKMELIRQAVQITDLHDSVLKMDTRLSKIEINQEYTKQGIDRIETWLKNISTKIYGKAGNN